MAGKIIRVKPLPKREQTGNRKWQVLVSGARKTTHRKKSAAVDTARNRHMRAADTVVVHKMSGAKQREFSGPRA